MEIAIPTIPAGIVILVNFFAPYAVSVVVSPLWPKTAKKLVSIGVSLLLAGIVLVLAYVGFGISIPAWPTLLLLGIVVTAFSYSVILKDSADKVTALTGVGAQPQAVLVSSATVEDK